MAEFTYDSQMLFVGLSFLLNSESVISVLPVHRLNVPRADSVLPFLHEHVAWTGRHAPILNPLTNSIKLRPLITSCSYI